MAVNEITARRTIPDIKEEIETLRVPYERDALTSKTGRSS